MDGGGGHEARGSVLNGACVLRPSSVRRSRRMEYSDEKGGGCGAEHVRRVVDVARLVAPAMVAAIIPALEEATIADVAAASANLAHRSAVLAALWAFSVARMAAEAEEAAKVEVERRIIECCSAPPCLSVGVFSGGRAVRLLWLGQ